MRGLVKSGEVEKEKMSEDWTEWNMFVNMPKYMEEFSSRYNRCIDILGYLCILISL